MADKNTTEQTPEMDAKTAEFLERVSKPVGEETARERYERIQSEAKQFFAGLKQAAKDEDAERKNAVITEVVEPAFRAIIEQAEAFTGLTVRRLSARYTNLKGEEPEFKFSHTINKARAEKDEDES